MAETEVTFHNRRGERLAGVLCSTGDGDGPTPAILLCQGLSGVKHLVLPEIARGLADRGITSLRFDYGGCGESDGERGWIDPRARVDDAQYAFAWLAADDRVDGERIGAYGHSYGGPVAISLGARESRVRAVVAVSGPGDGVSMLRSVRSSWDWVAFKDRLREARAELAVAGVSTEVEVGEIFPFSPAFLAAYEQLKADGGSSALQAGADEGFNRFDLATVDAMLDFHPEDAARRLGGRPLLLVHGEDDDTAPVETVQAIYANAPGPKRQVVIPGAAHNDLDAGPGLTEVIDLTADWFVRHLVAPDPS